MSTEELQRELARIGDRAPVVDVPPDTWRRARRSVVRERVLAGAASAAVLAAVAAGVAWLPDRGDVPVTSGAPALPDVIRDAPTYSTGQDADDLTYSGDVETDLAIGPAAVAYATDDNVPVVVDARTGGYHFLGLPGFTGVVALSPDGGQLAWSYADPKRRERRSDPMPSGVRVVDLRTGKVRDIPLTGGMGVSVYWLSWSPGGTWLLWGGFRTSEWDGGRYLTGGRSLLGVVAPDATQSQAVDPVRRQYQYAAVSDAGEVVLVTDDWTVRQGVGEPVVIEVARPSRSLFGVVFASFTDAGTSAILAEPDGYGYRIRDLVDGEAPDLTHGRRVGPAAQALVPLGWTDPGHLLVRTGPEVEDNGSTPFSRDDDTEELSQLAVLDVTSSELTVVGTIERGTPSITVATGLVGLDRPTVDRPEPDWPFEWTDARLSAAIGLGVAALIALWLGVRLLWRRYGPARYASWARTDHSAASHNDSSTSW